METEALAVYASMRNCWMLTAVENNVSLEHGNMAPVRELLIYTSAKVDSSVLVFVFVPSRFRN